MTSRGNDINSLVSKEIDSIMHAKQDKNPAWWEGSFSRGTKVRWGSIWTWLARFFHSCTTKLKIICSEYPRKYIARDRAAQEEMWEEAFKIHPAIIFYKMGWKDGMANASTQVHTSVILTSQNQNDASWNRIVRSMKVFKQTAADDSTHHWYAHWFNVR